MKVMAVESMLVMVALSMVNSPRPEMGPRHRTSCKYWAMNEPLLRLDNINLLKLHPIRRNKVATWRLGSIQNFHKDRRPISGGKGQELDTCSRSSASGTWSWFTWSWFTFLASVEEKSFTLWWPESTARMRPNTWNRNQWWFKVQFKVNMVAIWNKKGKIEIGHTSDFLWKKFLFWLKLM